MMDGGGRSPDERVPESGAQRPQRRRGAELIGLHIVLAPAGERAIAAWAQWVDEDDALRTRDLLA